MMISISLCRLKNLCVSLQQNLGLQYADKSTSAAQFLSSPAPRPLPVVIEAVRYKTTLLSVDVRSNF